MYIKFNEIVIKNFQAIKSTKLDLDNQGIVLVKGINEYESNANSNGSGKSSIFESLIWCIFGKTSNGIIDVKNRYDTNGCLVELDFNIDNENYKIIRSIKDKEYGSGVKLYCNGNDITRKNKTDTEKQIKEIFNFDIDIFLSTIYLSQGFNSRIGILTPSGRKERIELLTGIADRVEEFKETISNIKSDAQKKLIDIESNISYNQGKENSMLGQLEEYESTLSVEIDESIKEFNVDSIENLKDLSNQLQEKIQMVYQEYCNTNQQKSRYVKLNNDNNNKLKSLVEQTKELDKGICPLCESHLVEKKSKEVLERLQKEIDELELNIANIDKELNETSDLVDTYYNKYLMLKQESDITMSELEELEQKYKLYLDYKSQDKIRSMVTELKSKILDVGKKIELIKDDYKNAEKNYDIANHCVSLVSKSFRTYLLDNILMYMNNKLIEYSKMLFSNGDLINLKSESNKLNIYLGDALYETCSGGEKRKIDIALTVVQRDMLLEIVGVSSNVIILDEVIDFCDEVATDTILNMLLSVSDTVSTMAIISHNNYNIPYDKIIKVIKGIDRCATVEVE